MPQFFIYNGQYTSQESANDLKSLLSNEQLFDTKPSVEFTDLHQNFTGLKTSDRPTIVMPGGSAIMMGEYLGVERTNKVQELVLKHSYNYIGVCAGAYIAAEEIQFTSINYRQNGDNTAFEKPRLEISCKGFINIADKTKTIGPFYPNNSQHRQLDYAVTSNTYVPYVDKIKLRASNQEIPALYVGGCGFSQSDSAESIASYSADAYQFRSEPTTGENKQAELVEMPLDAVVSKSAKGSQGNILLSGVHFEAVGRESCLLRSFQLDKYNQAGRKVCQSLRKSQYIELIKQEKQRVEFAQDLVRSAVRKQPR